MPAKLAIICPGRPVVNGSKRRSFLWNETHKCYIHENRLFEEREFNQVVEAVFKKNADLRPLVRVIKFSDAPAIVQPVATISRGAEITLEVALQVVQREAPERLRKTHTTGRPKSSGDQMAVG